MLGKIVEVGTVIDTPLTYVLVHIWSSKASHNRGDKPAGDNAFIMDLVADEDTPLDIVHYIEEYLSRRLLSKSSYPAFHAKPSISRGNSDPRGVLIMAATQGLLGTEVTVK